MRTTKSGESTLLLLDVAESLLARKVGYAVVGALAASVHGAVRASLDADVLLSVGLQEAKSLESAFKDAGFRTEASRGGFDDPIPGMLKVSDSYGNRVDLLLGLKGLDPNAFTRLIDVPFQGNTLKFIGREDFIAMKVFAGGPIDIVDATRAISAGRNSLDLALLRRLAMRYGHDAADALERVLAG
jgi:predicted nucleotidyltransferase